MMRWNDMPRSILFSLAAATIAIAHGLLVGVYTLPHGIGPIGGSLSTISGSGPITALWIFLVAVYAFGLAARDQRARRHFGLGAALALLVTGTAVAAMGAMPSVVLAALAGVLGCIRGLSRESGSRTRNIAIEGIVAVGSIVLSTWLMAAFAMGPVALAAGVWGFFLTQSLALAPIASPQAKLREVDAFECARRRLESLLDEGLEG